VKKIVAVVRHTLPGALWLSAVVTAFTFASILGFVVLLVWGVWKGDRP